MTQNPRRGSKHVESSPLFTLFNRIVTFLLAAGVPMGPDVLLTVRGRKSGLPRSTPVAIAEISGRLWLLSPFGETNWARNLRAARRGVVRSGWRTYEITARELDREERISFYRTVLNPYLETNRVARWIVRNVDHIGPDPVEAAGKGPVFEVQRAAVPAGGGTGAAPDR